MFSLIEASGSDVGDFLQSQLTGDILTIKNGESLFTGLCNIKGRLIASMRVYKNVDKTSNDQNDSFGLLINDQIAPLVCKLLHKYILRSKVKLTISNNSLIVNNIFKTQKSIEDWLGYECINYRVWLSLETSEKYTPQMLGLDKNQGISFTKGCYPGQEVVARTHYLGKAKRTLALIKLNGLDINQKFSIGQKVYTEKQIKVGDLVQIGKNLNQSVMLATLNVEAEPKKLFLDWQDETLELKDVKFQT